MGKRIAIFVPAHDEEQTLARVINSIREVLHTENTYILVVDDASTDETASIAKLNADHVIVNNINRGVGATTKTGLCYLAEQGDFELVVKLDGDGQHDTKFLPQVVSQLRSGKDLVICSRFHPDSDQTHTPIDRILLNTTITDQVKRITGWQLSDARSGFMGFHYDDVCKVAPTLVTEGYGIPMDLIIGAWTIKPNAAIIEIPHPAMYDRKISAKLDEKYSTEQIEHQSSRLAVAYAALLKIVEKRGITQEHILRVNGLAQNRREDSDTLTIVNPISDGGTSEVAILQ